MEYGGHLRADARASGVGNVAAQSDPRNPNARYYRSESVTLAVIITDKEADARQALHMLASGKPFAAVAQMYSKDKSSANGGLLPPVVRGRVDPKKFPGLERTIFGMKVGQQLDTLKLAGAWWIIRCVDRTAEKRVPFEQVVAECREGARLTKGLTANGAQMRAGYASFQKDATIEALWPQYTAAANVTNSTSEGGGK